MEVIETNIKGVFILNPKLFKDSRGYFFESYSSRDFTSKIGEISFVQDNESKSTYGVLRGLHFQKPPYAQSKLVRCVRGAVLDVSVDLRKDSPTYGQHVLCLLCGHDEEGERFAMELGESVGLQLFIPKGFAHGFAVLSHEAIFQYKCDEFYHPESEGAIAWNDPDLNIDWHLPVTDIILSDKDKNHPYLKVITSPFYN